MLIGESMWREGSGMLVHGSVHNQGKRTRVSRVRVRVRVPEHALEHATLPPEHAPNLRVFVEKGYICAYI
jgi:hypothetical protein